MKKLDKRIDIEKSFTSISKLLPSEFNPSVSSNNISISLDYE
jgi:hypothetical protein